MVDGDALVDDAAAWLDEEEVREDEGFDIECENRLVELLPPRTVATAVTSKPSSDIMGLSDLDLDGTAAAGDAGFAVGLLNDAICCGAPLLDDRGSWCFISSRLSADFKILFFLNGDLVGITGMDEFDISCDDTDVLDPDPAAGDPSTADIKILEVVAEGEVGGEFIRCRGPLIDVEDAVEDIVRVRIGGS